ncbi:hypothetical protein L9F63_014700 [Diploptera punctata]|uniref:Uncharacterized protein n=1 Tax=Diploptera punctata TaxID=6984 RepID=A0AAD8ELA8_DIPPU|nr:hypothetical protein L9F63_014700 [Diploptera punctata]
MQRKKLLFSICTDKKDCYDKVPKDIHLLAQTEPEQVLNCGAKLNERSKKISITHKKTGVLVEPRKCAEKCDVKKTLVRNVEQTIPPHCTLIKRKQSPAVTVNFDNTGASNTEVLLTGSKSVYKSKYSAPELYTTLCIAKEIQTTSIKTGIKNVDIPQTAKQMLDEKILSRLNFPFEEKLYKRSYFP